MIQVHQVHVGLDDIRGGHAGRGEHRLQVEERPLGLSLDALEQLSTSMAWL